jgi:putative oxygen-independent coproporphyrinogen III oxidase
MFDPGPALARDMQNPDDAGFGVYVHWPFCAQKCPYCDFNSHVRHKGWDEARFLSAYKQELAHTAEAIGKRQVSSIFIGGGTPSLMQPQTVAGILDAIAGLWSVQSGAEITIEANPNSVEAERFRGYRAAGVNRVSLGVQSLRDEQLKALGRLHSVAEAKTAIGIAAQTFDRFSFDLIYARPGQTPEQWRRELAEALALGSRHLSLYQLTIEPETAFEKLHVAGKLAMPDAELAAELYGITQEMTDAAGLRQYEISNHAVPGEESRHNILYWRYAEYAGVGPGAHGRVIVGGQRRATSTERNPEGWAARVESAGHGLVADEPLGRDEQADEMLLMGLRMADGLDLARLAQLGGVTIRPETIFRLRDEGLLDVLPPGREGFGDGLDEISACLSPGLGPGLGSATATIQGNRGGGRIRVTRAGRIVLNEVVLALSRAFVSGTSTMAQDAPWTSDSAASIERA